MIKLKCNDCGTIHKFEDTELDYELVGSDPDRQMGTENEYSGTIEFDCVNCSNHIIVEFNFWEYPVMALNYSEFTEEGCIVLEEPDYHVYLSQPNDDDYEN